MSKVHLHQIAYARSGDKGRSANLGVIAHTPAGFKLLQEHLTEARLSDLFRPMKVSRVVRYELPNLLALNFMLHGVLASSDVTLRTDAQGKALGQALLQLEIDVPDEQLAAALERK